MIDNFFNVGVELLADPRYYLENFCKIKGKEGKGLIPFILKPAQLDIFNTIQKHNRIIIMKSRQIGFSTAVTGFLYHKTITTGGVSTALVGYNNDLTAELLDKIKTFYRTTPDALKPTIHYNSKYEISFPAVDSKILVLPSTENVGRGYTLNFCLLTEVPFWDKAEEKMITLEASVPVNGKIIIESCVTGDTLILTKDGPRYIRDIINWNKFPLGIFKSKRVQLDTHRGIKNVNTFHKNGIREGYRVTTVSGNSIGMSNIHPLLIMDKGVLGMKKAEDIKLGDYIVTKIGQNLWGNFDNISNFKSSEYGFNKKNIFKFSPKRITKDLAYLMGVILGDGHIYKTKFVEITNMDKDIDNFLLSHPLGLKFIRTKKEGKCNAYRCTNQSFAEFLRYMGFEYGLVAKNKQIPNRILGMSRKNVIAFLQGLFDTDGTSSKKNGRVGFSSTSKQITDIVRNLLLNLGIVTSVHGSITKPTKKVKVYSYVYKLQVSSSFSKTFYKEVGFRMKRKQNNFRFIPKIPRGMVIPGIGQMLYAVLKEKHKLGIVKKFSRKSLYSIKGGITYQSLRKILDYLGYFDGYEFFKKLYESNYFYDKVTRKDKIKEEVYDFTVPKAHTFIANGFVSSNSPGAIGDYFHRMWVSDNDYVKKEYGWWWNYSKEEIEIIRRRMNNPRKFNNNYALEFLISGRSVFTKETIDSQRKNILNVGDKVKLSDGSEHIVREDEGFRIYKPPEHGHFYAVGADCSEGVTGGDYAAVVVLDRTNGEEVGFWRGHIAPDRFAKVLNKWGRQYNNALMVVEAEAHGNVVLNILKQLLYPALYFRPSRFDTIGNPFSDKLGWKTTRITRPILIDEFEQTAREGSITIHSKEIVEEMTVFVFNDANNMVCLEGFNDDTIFATAIALQGFKVLSGRKMDQIEYKNYLPKSGGY